MWITDKALDWFKISQDSFTALREEAAMLRTERDFLQRENTSLKLNMDWLRMQVNTLQMERAALMEKAYDIKLPAPELVRAPVLNQEHKFDEFSFDDIGDAAAKMLGLPTYDLPKPSKATY